MEYGLYRYAISICARQNNLRSTLNLESNFARAGETTYRANGKKLSDQLLNNRG